MENQSLQTNMNEIVRMGKVFFESGMFSDLQNMAQAIVKVQAGAELGIPAFQSISGVHIIKGKAVIGAGLMASMVDRHPEYDYEVLVQSDQECAIRFYKNDKVRGTSRFTKEDAAKAGTQNMGKFPANMLYARAMSNGVKWYCPGVFAGPVYVPEEMQPEQTEETTYVEVKAPEQPVQEAEQVQEAEVVVEEKPADTKPVKQEELMTDAQRKTIEELLPKVSEAMAKKAKAWLASEEPKTLVEAAGKIQKLAAAKEKKA